jgi:hypothetical protein
MQDYYDATTWQIRVEDDQGLPSIHSIVKDLIRKLNEKDLIEGKQHDDPR